ncbi:hypothetical protein V6N13_137646 [Hibiscus sabdariffa]
MYQIIEHFALGSRRLELFGEEHNIRYGWLTVGKGLSSSNFNAEVSPVSFDMAINCWPTKGSRWVSRNLRSSDEWNPSNHIKHFSAGIFHIPESM